MGGLESEIKEEGLNSEINEEEFRCVRYMEREGCRTCDSFGRNSDERVDTKECYLSRKDERNKENIKYIS